MVNVLRFALSLLVGWGTILLAISGAAQTVAKKPDAKPSGFERSGVKLPPEFRALLRDAEQLQKIKPRPEAEEKLRQAEGLIERVNRDDFNLDHVKSAHVLAKANLKFNDAIKGNQKQLLEETLQEYARLPAGAAPEQKTQAAINQAAIYMKLNDPKKAASILLDEEKYDWKAIDPSQVFLLNYNRGQALAKDQNTAKALQYYGASLQENPRFKLAAQQVCDVALEDRELDAAALDKQVELLLATKHYAEVARLGWGVFEREGKTRTPQSLHGLSILLTGWSRSYESAEQFRKDEEGKFKELSSEALGPRFSRDLQRIAWGVLQVEPRALEQGEHPQLPGVTELLRAAGSERKRLQRAVAEFIFAVGDDLATKAAVTSEKAESGEFAKGALARHIVVIGLAQDHSDAARSLVWALLQCEATGALDGGADSRDQLVREFLQLKQGLYYKTNKTVVDWQNLLKIHLLLARVFQAQERWNAPGMYQSATYFWKEAERDERELRKAMKDNPWPWNPEIPENLAICYSHATDKTREVAQAWLEASRRYVEINDLVGATRGLKAVEAMREKLSDEQRRELGALEASYRDLKLRLE